MIYKKTYGFSEIDNLRLSFVEDLTQFIFISPFAAVLISYIIPTNFILGLILGNCAVIFMLYNANKQLHKKKENAYNELMTEKKDLEEEFKVILDKNPATVEDYTDSFLSIYGDNYPEHIQQFKRLLYLSQKTTSDEIEDAIRSYFSHSLYQEDNLKHLHYFKPIYDLELIYKFANKYNNYYNILDIEKLNTLLLQKGIRFHDIKLLKYLVSYSVTKQNYFKFKKMILRTNPRKEIDYINSFLHAYKGGRYNMDNLYLLLLERKVTDLSFKEFNEYMDIKIKEYIDTKSNIKLKINDIDVMNGYDFESFIGSLYEKMGYSVELTPKSGDQGADLIITKLGERTAVQTKNYKGKVSNKAIQEVVASKKYYGCTTCFVVTNSYFTESALELGEVNNVKLIDRDELNALINNYM